MSLRPLASLGVKLLGLYAIINALSSIGYITFPFLAGASSIGGTIAPWKMALLNALPGSFQMIIGICLWAFSDGISHSLVKDEGETPLPSQTTWGALLFSAVGAFSLVEFAVQLAHFLRSMWLVNQIDSVTSAGTAHIGAPDLIPILLRGALGLWLLLGSRGLVRGVMNLKNVGRDG